MKRHFQILLLILVMLLLFALAYSAAEGAHHDCAEEDCRICAMLFLISSLWVAGLFLLILAVSVLQKRRLSTSPERKVWFSVTPVSLKNKISD